MSASVRWSGLEELKAKLQHLPEDLTADAGHIVESAADSAAAGIRQGYEAHRVTGNLAAGVKVTHFEKGKFSAGAIVKNTAKHAWLFENGSQARHYVTVNGKRHQTGAMPPGHVFVPVAIRERRKMYDRLKDMLQQHGLQVSGDAR